MVLLRLLETTSLFRSFPLVAIASQRSETCCWKGVNSFGSAK